MSIHHRSLLLAPIVTIACVQVPDRDDSPPAPAPETEHDESEAPESPAPRRDRYPPVFASTGPLGITADGTGVFGLDRAVIEADLVTGETLREVNTLPLSEFDKRYEGKPDSVFEPSAKEIRQAVWDTRELLERAGAREVYGWTDLGIGDGGTAVLRWRSRMYLYRFAEPPRRIQGSDETSMPFVSPDGTRVVFRACEDKPGCGVMLVDLDDPKLAAKRIEGMNHLVHTVWSPSSAHALAYGEPAGSKKQCLFKIDRDGGRAQTVRCEDHLSELVSNPAGDQVVTLACKDDVWRFTWWSTEETRILGSRSGRTPLHTSADGWCQFWSGLSPKGKLFVNVPTKDDADRHVKILDRFKDYAPVETACLGGAWVDETTVVLGCDYVTVHEVAEPS